MQIPSPVHKSWSIQTRTSDTVLARIEKTRDLSALPCSAPTVRSVSVPTLSVFSGITSASPTVEIDERTQSAFVSFVSAGRPRWSASVWLDGSTVEGFVLRDADTGVELVVRSPASAAADPLIAWVTTVVKAALS